MAIRSGLTGLGAYRIGSLGLAMIGSLQAPVQAAELAGNAQWIWAAGIIAHDRGPTSDRQEDGIDLNLEVQFAPLDIFGSPRPHLGVTANFEGDTSVAYGGLSFRFRETPQWFIDGLLGVALHNGPLHKDPVRCQLYSDCGYGTRFLPRFGLEVGYRISPDASVSLFYDHMSHKWIVAGENEGLDHLGVRYLRAY